MRIVIFTHSLLSDWNHGNAHFLRGIASELTARGHELRTFEPEDGWSFRNLISSQGPGCVDGFYKRYPGLNSEFFDLAALDLDSAIEGADLVLVHEWNPHELVRRIGEHRASNGSYVLLFHDTHHRSVTDPDSMGAYDLRHYDGVLAYGTAIREIYSARDWTRRAWTWHEAADTRVFHPLPEAGPCEGDLVWIGNWGDGERDRELEEFLIEPVKSLGLKARVYGVRYPEPALEALRRAGIEYGGWLPNYSVPEIFARFRVTVHIPRGPYARSLPGIPTIRPFEALACGIPLVSAPWEDREELFSPGEDYLGARDGQEMERHLRSLLSDPSAARKLAAQGLETILARHTCAHRVDELLGIREEAQACAAFAGAQGED
jgi:spore maturation protein CgeB